MAFTNDTLKPSNDLYILLAPVIFQNVRSTVERTSNRKRQCYGTGKKIAKNDKYINHQFRYDGRIITISFCISYFNGC
jgi:hypothetical protein